MAHIEFIHHSPSVWELVCMLLKILFWNEARPGLKTWEVEIFSELLWYTSRTKSPQNHSTKGRKINKAGERACAYRKMHDFRDSRSSQHCAQCAGRGAGKKWSEGKSSEKVQLPLPFCGTGDSTGTSQPAVMSQHWGSWESIRLPSLPLPDIWCILSVLTAGTQCLQSLQTLAWTYTHNPAMSTSAACQEHRQTERRTHCVLCLAPSPTWNHTKDICSS